MPRSTASISAGRSRAAEMSLRTEPTRSARSTLCTRSNSDGDLAQLLGAHRGGDIGELGRAGGPARPPRPWPTAPPARRLGCRRERERSTSRANTTAAAGAPPMTDASRALDGDASRGRRSAPGRTRRTRRRGSGRPRRTRSARGSSRPPGRSRRRTRAAASASTRASRRSPTGWPARRAAGCRWRALIGSGHLLRRQREQRARRPLVGPVGGHEAAAGQRPRLDAEQARPASRRGARPRRRRSRRRASPASARAARGPGRRPRAITVRMSNGQLAIRGWSRSEKMSPTVANVAAVDVVRVPADVAVGRIGRRARGAGSARPGAT